MFDIVNVMKATSYIYVTKQINRTLLQNGSEKLRYIAAKYKAIVFFKTLYYNVFKFDK